jgi:hypothetical protein
MSSITAPMPRAGFRVPARWYAVAVTIAATAVAVLIAAYAWLTGNQPIRSDALGYYELALRIAREGPLAFESAFRTYGYPFFLALLIRIVGPDPETVRTAGFVTQLTLFVVAAWIGARRLSLALGLPNWTPWIYAVTVFSPFILIHAIQMLTDVLSAVLVYVAVVFSLPTGPRGTAVEARPTRRTVLHGMLALFLGGLAVIVRPANLVLVPVLLLAWLYRTIRTRDLPWRAWPVLFAMLVLPFVPQMVFNYRAYGEPRPLLMLDLYSSNTVVGVQVAKYGTLNIAGVPSRLHYFNPFRPAEELTTGEFMRQDPVRFGATLALHAFALFDHDFPFAYISDVNPWYRWPLAIPNYLFLLGGVAGLLIGLRWPLGSGAAERECARVTIGLLGAATGALVVIYLPSAVESRFSLPMYPLLAAPFVLAVERTGVTSRRRPLVLALVTLGAAVWVGGMATTSLWLEKQAPLLQNVRATLAAPLPPSPSASYQVQLPEDWEPGQIVTVPITVTNTGPDTWSLEGFFNVSLRVQIVATKSEQHRLLPKGARVYVNPTAPIAPGESANLVATVETPTATGRYIMSVTVIRTGIEETTPGFEQPIRVDKGR